MSTELKNYPDSKCCYGYMTICLGCINKAPRHVDTKQEIVSPLPKPQCEICKRKETKNVAKPNTQN
jgi:hypothetical protein